MTIRYNLSNSNGTPATIFKGIKDNSTRPVPFEQEVYPIHIPLFYTYAEKGPTIATYGYGSAHAKLYGENIFDEASAHGTLATPFINLMTELGNPFMLQRVIPEDARKEATLCLALEVIKTDKLQRFARKADGHVQFDHNANPVFDGTTIQGHIARWKIINTNNAKLGIQEVRVGDGKFQYEGDKSATSMIYPIVEFQAQWIGAYANNLGLRIWSPTVRSEEPVSASLVQDQKAMLYRMQIVERENERANPRPIKTIRGQDYVEGTFKLDTYDHLYREGAPIDLEDNFLEAYEDNDTRGGKDPEVGPLKDMFIYHDNIETLVSMFFEAEKLYNSQFESEDATEGRHLFNFVGGHDLEGRAYISYILQNELTGAHTALTERNTHYLQGGFDGTMNNVEFDKLVREEFKNFGKNENKYLDIAFYPFHQIYDVGYTTATKKAMFNAIAERPDTNLTLSPCDFVTNPYRAPSADETASIGAALKSMANRFPESIAFGTKVCRVVITPEAMKLINNPKYKRWVPMTYQVAAFRGRYMGKPDGMAPGIGYDEEGYNLVTHGKNVTNMSQSYNALARNWDNGMSYWAYLDRRTVFAPAVCTAYDEPTSVLTSDILMQSLCDMTFQLRYVWAGITGNSKLPPDELFERANNIFIRRTIGRYDNRYIVTPKSFQTEQDAALGYRMTTEIEVKAANMMTVLVAYPVVDRIGG